LNGWFKEVNRRALFSNAGINTTAVKTGANDPALAYLYSLSDDLKALSKDFNGKFETTKEQLQSLHNRLGGAALTMTHQRM
jgi:tRNA(His) 5'-end guanylyltransferase